MDRITGAAGQIESVSNYIVAKYEADDYEVQKLRIEETNLRGIVIQVRNTSCSGFANILKSLTGSSLCATLKLIPLPDGDLQFEVGQGKWVDKAALMTLSMFVLWPLAITSGIGAIRQKNLLTNLHNDVVSYFAGHKSE